MVRLRATPAHVEALCQSSCLSLTLIPVVGPDTPVDQPRPGLKGLTSLRVKRSCFPCRPLDDVLPTPREVSEWSAPEDAWNQWCHQLLRMISSGHPSSG